jgi:hypothetical protein
MNLSAKQPSLGLLPCQGLDSLFSFIVWAFASLQHKDMLA